MPDETPSKRFERWSFLAGNVIRELDLYKAEVGRFTDERARQDERLQKLASRVQAALDEANAESKRLDEALLVANQLPTSALSDVSDLDELQKGVEKLRLLFDRAEDATMEYDTARRQYQVLDDESHKWLQHTPEAVKQFSMELDNARTTMRHVLYAMRLGKVANGKDAKAHILRFAVRHPGAPIGVICAYLDSRDVPLPTKEWRERVERKYGYAFWKYSFNGNAENPADKKLAHRTFQYVWRYQEMGNDLRSLYKIKRFFSLRKLKLPTIDLPPKNS